MSNVVPIHPGDRGLCCYDCRKHGTAECGIHGMAGFEAACAEFQKGGVRSDDVWGNLDQVSVRLGDGDRR